MFKKTLALFLCLVSPAFADVTFDGTTMTGSGAYSEPVNVSNATGQTVTITPSDVLTLSSTVTGSGTVKKNSGAKLQLTGDWSGFSGAYSFYGSNWTELFSTSFQGTVIESNSAATNFLSLCTGNNTTNPTAAPKNYYIGALIGGDAANEIRNSTNSSNSAAYLIVGSSTVLVTDENNVFNGKIVSNNAKGLGLEKTGVGTWTLTSAQHAYTLGTKVSGGTLRILGGKLPAGTVTIDSGATLKLEDTTSAKVTLDANTNYTVNGTLWFDMKADRRDFNSAVSGSGTIVKTQDSTYRTLTIGGDFSGFSGAIDNQSPRLIELKDTMGDTSNVTLTSTVSKGDNAAFVLWATTTDSGKNYKTFTFKAIEGNNDIGVSDYDKAKALLRVGSDSASDSSTFNAVLRNYGTNAVLGFEKIGASTLTLTKNPTFPGGLTVSGGTLLGKDIVFQAGDTSKFLQTTHSIEVKNGGTLTAEGGKPIDTAHPDQGYKVFESNSTIDIASGGKIIVEGTNGNTTIGSSITITGSGILEHGSKNNNNKVLLQANMDGFTGIVRNTSTRYIELFSYSETNVPSDSPNAIYDSGAGGQGFAFWVSPSNSTITYELGALIGNGNCVASDRNNGSKVILKVGTDGQSLIADADNIYKSVLSNSTVPLALEKVGDNTWTLTNTHSYSGGTTVSEGTLLFQNGTLHAGDPTKFITTTHSFEVKNGATLQLTDGNVGGGVTLDIAKGGKFVYDTSGDRAMPDTAVVTGSGEVIHSEISKNGKLQIKSDFTGFTGTVRNAGGRYIELFSKADGTNISTSANAIYTASNPSGGQGQAFAFVAQTDDVNTPVVFELGALTGSCLSLASGFSTANSKILLKVGSDGETLIPNEQNVLSGRISGDNRTLSVEKVGTNTWTLTGDNTYSGSTTITGGTLKVGNGGTTGNISSKQNTIGKAGTLEVDRSNNLTWAGIKLTTETNGSPATPWKDALFNPTTDAQYITANLVKDGDGTLKITLAADMPSEQYYTGTTRETGVPINANIQINGGTLEIQSLNEDQNVHKILRGQLTGTGTLLHSDSNRKLALFGDNTAFEGRVKSTSGRYVELYSSKSASAKAVYEMNGSQGLAYVATDASHFKLGAIVGNNPNTYMIRSDYSVAGPITVEVGSASISDEENVFQGNLGFHTNNYQNNINYVKVGDSQWTLTGTSIHAGTTTVDDGTLYLTSSASFLNSPVTVNEDGTLILQGTLGKDLTVNGDLEIDFTQGGLQQEAIVEGNALFGDTGKLSVNVGSLTEENLWGAYYKLTSDNSLDLTPYLNDAIAAGRAPSYLMVYDNGSTIGLNYGSVPEPTAWVLLALGALGILAIRKRK